MIEECKQLFIRLMKLPPEPPAPYGEEKSLRVFRASPQFLKYQLVMWGIGQTIFGLTVLSALIGLLVAAFSVRDEVGRVLLLLGAFVLLLGMVVEVIVTRLAVYLDYEMRWYKVTDRSLRIREGVFFVREMTMTFLNIQNIEVSQGPIQRWLGIADLKVQTAGGGGGSGAQSEGGHNQHMFNMHVGLFRGVDNATEIMTLMQERLRRSRSAGLGDLDEAEEETVVAAPVGASSTLSAARALLDEARAFRLAATARRDTN